MIMQMMMSHDEPGSKHQITVKKKKKKSKMNDNAFRDKENWTNLQLRPKKHTTFDSFFGHFLHILLKAKCSPDTYSSEKDRYVDDCFASHLRWLRIHMCQKTSITHIHTQLMYMIVHIRIIVALILRWASRMGNRELFCIIVICMHL